MRMDAILTSHEVTCYDMWKKTVRELCCKAACSKLPRDVVAALELGRVQLNLRLLGFRV